jgi:3-methyladenine DNA glycosylase Mpg
MTFETVGEFYVYLIHGSDVALEMTSSTKLLSTMGKPSVIHFYDGG